MIRIITYVWKKMKNYRLQLFVSVLLLIISTILTIINPILAGKYINLLTAGASLIQVSESVLLLTLSWLTGGIISYLESIIGTQLSTQITYTISLHLLNHAEHLPYLEISRHDPGYLNNRIQNDSSIITSFFLDSVIGSIINVISCISVVIIMFRLNASICFIILSFIPIHMLIYRKFAHRIEQSSGEMMEKRDNFYGEMNHQLHLIHTIKVNVWYTQTFTLLYRYFRILYHAVIKSARVNSLYSTVMQCVQVSSNTIIFLVCGFSVYTGRMVLGDLIAINSLFSILLSGFTNLVGCGKSYKISKAAYNRIDDLESIPEEHTGKIVIEDIQEIDIKDVSFCYVNEGSNTLDHITAKFVRGKVYQIIGDNGCGKSTLLDIILGIHIPAGEVCYNGIDLRELDMPEMRKRFISVVEQEPPLVFKNVFDNITGECLAYQFFIQEINKLDMRDFMGGLNSFLDGNTINTVHHISGGEKQKIAIFRALQKRPQVLILDEPSSALDSNSCEKLKTILERMRQEMIIILVDHQSVFSDIIDTTYYLKDGYLSS